MFKRVVSFSLLLLATSIYASEYSIKSGWQLLGAVEDIDNLSIFNKDCFNSLWTYKDKSWSEYSMSSTNAISSIKSGEGFWLNASNSCTVNTNQLFESRVVDGDEILVDYAQDLSWVNGTGGCFMGEVSQTTTKCEDLNFAGITNWRYPTTKELSMMIINANEKSVKLNYINPSCVAMVASDGYVRTENSDNVGEIFTEVPPNAGLRCVADNSMKLFESRVINGDEILVDNAQNLKWVNGTGGCFMGEVSQTTTKCGDLNFAGITNWRYPTTKELSMMIISANEKNVKLNYINPSCVAMVASDGYVRTENSDNVGEIFTEVPPNAGLRCVAE